MNKLQIAEQFRKALQMFVESLSDEKCMEIATVLPSYEVGKAYAIGDRFTYGTNGVDDPQIYKVVQSHTSAEEWKPSETPSLYSKVGVAPSGYDEWSQPTGAHDAYNKGDIVSYNGALYESLIDGNVYAPDVYPAGWRELTA